MASRPSRTLRHLQQQLSDASSYPQWLELAEAHDVEAGGDIWRQKQESGLYDSRSINTRLQRLRRLRKKGDDQGLLFGELYS